MASSVGARPIDLGRCWTLDTSYHNGLRRQLCAQRGLIAAAGRRPAAASAAAQARHAAGSADLRATAPYRRMSSRVCAVADDWCPLWADQASWANTLVPGPGAGASPGFLDVNRRTPETESRPAKCCAPASWSSSSWNRRRSGGANA
eukprot:scaffold132373_cov30-Tisochrysis_lutea.AAC.2